MRSDLILPLILVFGSLSLSSVGGGSSTLAAMQHQTVDVHNWLTSREFVELFAISRAAPGPGSMLATLVGWKVGGWAGAAITTLSLYVPSSILCFLVARTWHSYSDRKWHAILRTGLAPIGTGLALSAVVAIARVSGAGIFAWAMAGVAAAIMLIRPNVHPLLLLAGGGVVAMAAVPFQL
ncbi:MAG TPA: chromate transporter [Devosia sp.]|nr:chromate transporter [Devosia sp.]